MGLNINGTKILLSLHKQDFSFGKVLTIGRQRLNVTKAGLQKNLNHFKINGSATALKQEQGGYCEPFFKLLGARSIESLDVSDYESANFLHDMNTPVPDSFKEQFNTVLDSGSLEHVFNFPVAVRNCMEMVAMGGHFIGITPCNNFFGHGFYQFSPELFYRVFSESNGFAVKQMLFFLDQPSTSFYEVADPLKVRERVILNNTTPSYLFVLAQRIAKTEIFSVTPQQSDYEHIVWAKEKKRRRIERLIPKPLRKLPRPLRNLKDVLALVRSDIGTGEDRHFRKIQL